MSDVETKLYNLEERIKPLEEEIAQNILTEFFEWTAHPVAVFGVPLKRSGWAQITAQTTEEITLVCSHNRSNLTVV